MANNKKMLETKFNFSFSTFKIYELTLQTKDRVMPLKFFDNGDIILGKNFKLLINEKLTFGDILFFDFEEDLDNLRKSSIFVRLFKFLKLIPKYYSRHLIMDTSRKIANYSLRADKEEYHVITEFSFDRIKS